MVAADMRYLSPGVTTNGSPPAPIISRQLTVTQLPGLMRYVPMWEQQRMLAAARVRQEIGDQLLLLEHPHVYTTGRAGDRKNLLADPATLQQIGATYHRVDRGGDITYHGPGQLVGYPIIGLEEAGLTVRSYVRGLETAIVQAVAHVGVTATTVPGYTGVWVGDHKVASIGVRVSRGVAYHGFALNVAPDLSYFRYIVPCGITDRGVTSIAQLTGLDIGVSELASLCAEAVAEVFGMELDNVSGNHYHAAASRQGILMAVDSRERLGVESSSATSSGHGEGIIPNS